MSWNTLPEELKLSVIGMMSPYDIPRLRQTCSITRDLIDGSLRFKYILELARSGFYLLRDYNETRASRAIEDALQQHLEWRQNWKNFSLDIPHCSFSLPPNVSKISLVGDTLYSSFSASNTVQSLCLSRMIQSPESNLVNERQVRWQSHTAKANKFDFNTYRHPRNPSRRLISEDYLATLKVGPKRIVLSVVLEALHSRTFMSLELPGLTLPHRFYSVFWADSAPKTGLLSHTGVSDIIAAHVILVLETEAEGVIYYRNYVVVLDRQGIVDMADRCLHSGQKSVLWNDWKRLARWFPYEGDGGRDCLPIFHSRMIMLARPKSIETLTNRPTGLRGSLHLVMIDFGKASPGGDAENSAFVGEIAPSLTNGDFKGDRWTGLSFRISWSNKAFKRDILRSERLHMNDNMLVIKEHNKVDVYWMGNP